MASGGREPSDFSSDDEILHSIKKRLKKPKAIVSSDTDSDTDTDFGIKHKKTLRPLNWESDEDTNKSYRHDDNSSSSSVSSDNEQTDKCAICLSKFSGQDIATPEGCDHTFCLLCLQEWAKNNNTCPIDRLKFNLILIRHHNEKKICKRIFINCPESDWLSDSESEEAPIPTETLPCAFCGFSEDVEALQMCRECDKNFHPHCLMHPPSARICPSCAFYISLSYFKSSRERINLHVRLSEARPDYQDYAREVCRVRQIQDIIRRLHEGRSMSASDTTSDEDTQHDGQSSVRYENGARSQYPLIQKRRRVIRRSQNQALVSTAISATSNPELYSAYSDEEINDTRHENSNNNRLSGPSGSSRSASSAYSRSTGDASTNPENFDIVGSILQSQALLHNSDVLKLRRNGAVFPDSNLSPNSKMNSASSSHDNESRQDAMPSFSQSRLILPCMDGAVYKQSPLNPTQNSNAKYQETPRENYTCTSSSSSSKGPSLDYDNVNISSRNTFTNSGNDRYNNDNSCSSINHKSFCGSAAEDIKKVSNFKESNKAHSEDEVDIYSDIESVGDDEGACNTIEGVDDRIEPMEMSFKDNSPSSNPGPGSDSSDNELIIDEDMAVDDENENRKENIQINNSKDKSGTLENEHINESEESNISYPDDFNQEQSSRMHEVQDNGSYVGSHSAEDSQLNEESSQGTFQSSYHGKYRNDSEYDESKHGSEYEVKNESEYDESRHGSEYEESKNEYESREVKNRSDDEDEDINIIENEDKDSLMVNENKNISEYDDQESDMDVQVFEENSIDSSKKSPRAETSTPCSTLSSPKQYDEEMKLENVDSQCDNSISGRMEEFYDIEDRKFAETTDTSSVQANENTSGSFSQVEDNENYQNENNSNFSFASSQNVMSEVEEGLDSNIDVSSQTFSEGDKPDINMDSNIDIKSKEYEEDDGELNNENIDYSENASTPCLDENIDGQIEDSPIHSDIADSTDPDIKSNVTDLDSKISRISLSNDEYEMAENENINSYKIENQHEISEKTSEIAVDLGIEDISEAGSGDLDDDFVNENVSFSESKELENTERENTSNYKFDDSSNQQDSKLISKHLEISQNSDQSYDDREEGEIVEEKPVCRIDRKRTEKREHYHDENEDYNDVAPRVNISDLPRIPKIKRDREKDTSPLDLPIETKRTSVLGRVDLGGGDISWKRLSKHTRDRSYRDGRPKDERVLYRERESRKKEKKFADTEWRNDSKSKRREEKKQESEKIKTEYEPRSRKSDKKDNKISDWDYSDRDKRSKSHKDKHKDKHKEKKDKGKHDKNKHSKDETKYSRDRSKDDGHYERELKIDKEQRFERVVYERGKCKEKDHKSKHKDRKSDNKPGKEHSREKHKHIHVSDHFSEKQREREVRKIDDKLKIVVEQKDSRKEKSKHKDKKEAKHDKKSIHHHEHRKKEVERTPYTELTSIESKEIFAKGDSIIINVSFNRASSPKDTNNDNIDANVKDGKNIEDFEMDEVIIGNDKGKMHSLTDKGKNILETSVTKRPATPPERTIPVLCVSESYWQGGDDSDANDSPISEKSVVEIPKAEEENDTMESVEPVGDNFSNSCNSTDEPEAETAVKEIISGNEESPEKTDKVDSSFVKEPETSIVPAKRRSPRSPSPPSPADNDSYDPCEPTRSPSPPPIPIAPPLPVGNPKPPPSPELPPLPPEPEPVDIVLEEAVCNKPSEFAVSSMVTPSSQTMSANTQTSMANSISMPSMLLPPPSFLSHTSTTTSSLPSLSSLIPPSNFNFQVNSHPNVIFQPNHVQQIIRGIVPTQMHTTTSIPPPPNPPSLPHMGSVPPPPPPPSAMALISQVRHPQMNVRPTLTPNSLLQNLTMGHPVTMAQMQLTHLHIPPNLSNAISSHQSPMMMPSQNQSLNLPVSIHNQPATRVVLSQNQVINHSVMVQNQNLVNKPQDSVLSHQNLLNNNSQKLDKVTPEKTEVIDMEVDSPYSPGDSPSMDSVCDYSPTCSPLTSPSKTKDIFDTLLPTDHRTSGRRTQDILGKAEKSKRSDSKSDTPNKRSKHEHKRHSVRMQLADKTKNRREQRIEKKLDDSQLKILDELPSSAVEMQVKEKFLKKLNRQERVVEEVKLVLKPYYKSRDVNKEEYKDILRKSVPKICHNKSGEINPVKVKALVESYIKKIKHSRKKADKKKSKLS